MHLGPKIEQQYIPKPKDSFLKYLFFGFRRGSKAIAGSPIRVCGLTVFGLQEHDWSVLLSCISDNPVFVGQSYGAIFDLLAGWGRCGR